MASEALSSAPVNESTLWFGFLGGAVAWLLHLVGAWLIAEYGCLWAPGTVLGGSMTVVALLVIVLSVMLAGAAAASALLAQRSVRRLRERGDGPERPLARFLASGGAILSGSFAFVIAVQSVPIFYFPDWC